VTGMNAILVDEALQFSDVESKRPAEFYKGYFPLPHPTVERRNGYREKPRGLSYIEESLFSIGYTRV
jgi:hypothetical protein